MASTLLADRILSFCFHLHFAGRLPKGVEVMNPFTEQPEVREWTGAFYRKFYSDNNPRIAILGINPGRLGAGATGIPFTDTKRLSGACGIPVHTLHTHEPSSVFVYRMIEAFGGPLAFYRDFYINSVCPLGFIRRSPDGKVTNLNYYDDPGLLKASLPFIIRTLNEQIRLGLHQQVCVVLGKENARTFRALNEAHGFFRHIEVLDHPRFIAQYRTSRADEYVGDYLHVLRRCISAVSSG